MPQPTYAELHEMHSDACKIAIQLKGQLDETLRALDAKDRVIQGMRPVFDAALYLREMYQTMGMPLLPSWVIGLINKVDEYHEQTGAEDNG